MAKIIGNSLYYVKKFIIERYGQKDYEKIVRNTDSQKILNDPIMSGKYYDQKVFSQLLSSLAKTKGEQALKDCGEYAAKGQLSGLYGLIAKIISIDVVLKKAESMWKKTWTEGKLEVHKNNDGFTLKVTDFRFNDAHRLQITHFFIGIASTVTKRRYQGKSTKINATSTLFSIYRS